MAIRTGEMPFLDHLEELRHRLLKALSAVIIGFAVGLWIVQRFQLVSLLKKPIESYLPGGKLTVLSPTEPVMIVLKLSFIVGLVFASPVIIYQTWAFLSPALYDKERKAVVPALFVGLVLFLTGGILGYVFIVPQALRVLFSFQSEALAPFITYDNYFGFVLQIVLALGISFELPLVIIVLAAIGLITPPALSRFRRFFVVLACIAGAILSPGTDIISMIMMTVPLLFLYEIGYAGTVLIYRRRRRAEARAAAGEPGSGAGRTMLILFCLLALGAGAARAQVPKRPPKPLKGDTTQVQPGANAPLGVTRAGADTGQPLPQAMDTATARRLGLPTAPTRSFPDPDSLLQSLVALPGYTSIRFASDSATLLAGERRILLTGHGITRRGTSVLQADAIAFDDSTCTLRARGSPQLFDQSSVLVADTIRYNTCERRALVAGALTNFDQNGATWFLRGNLAQDSSSSRLFASSGNITSCDLPVPHYHFSAREVKWISQTVLVARPAVLYVRDVPVLWLPFIFQDARPGRRSGILIPQFGINDIVRPNPGYNRQVTNLGYYWAPNDYLDLTARVDWYANRYVQFGVTGNYRWLDRFISGGVSYSRQHESGGGGATALRWTHRQNFNVSTTLNLNLNYISNSSIVSRNAIDPLLTTQQITSAVNFTKRFAWGNVTLGGNRRQSLTDKSASTQFPAFTISPKPLDLGRDITWSPALTVTNDLTSNSPQPDLLVANAVGGVDTLKVTSDSRVTAVSFDTPLRLGGFNWRNSFSMSDRKVTGLQSVAAVKVDNPATADPNDSLLVSRVYDGDFSTSLNWDTGINLPPMFRGSWKLQPSVGIENSTSQGPFGLRNRNTGGSYVFQGKRLSFGVSSSPTIFGFFPGIGPLQRIRHSVSPVITWNYRPAANIPEAFARALAGPGIAPQLRSDAVQTASISLSQNFEGKLKAAPGDTTAVDQPARKIRLLSISTSALTYDFEQAKKPGRTGWTTSTLSNTFQSDLLPGFNLSLTHSLWEGTVGTDSAKFKPFLQSVSASFALSGGTVQSLLSIFGLGSKSSAAQTGKNREPPASYIADAGQRRTGSFYSSDQVNSIRSGAGFSANFNFSLSRTRPVPGLPPQKSRQSLGFSTSFQPTPLWQVSWTSQYNITDGRFESQVVRLIRDMHDWRAGFNFVKNANGNFAFFFSIYLVDLPDVKFDYDQTTIKQ